MKKIFCLLILLGSGFAALAQQLRPMASSEIYQKLQQLKTMGTVMYFAAHPDDENTRLIAYLVHHDHVRTIYYSLTRGDGGQNILGNEQGAALGLIRTYELLQARKLDGAEQMFSPFVDFGYTTSVPETFSFWNKQKLVQDAVKAIQKTQPDIIICRFPTTGEGTHGQHTASAIVAKEAWLYIKHYNDTAVSKLWLPKRVLFNAFRFGSSNTIKEGQFKVRINQYDPLLGEGLGELAGQSRSQHKSQGAGTPQIAGVTTEHFQLVEGEPITHSLYDGIDTSWDRVGKPQIGKMLADVINQFDFNDPSASISPLLAIKKAIETMPAGYWKAQKLQEINQVILSCAGIMAEALTENAIATPGDAISVQIGFIARSDVPVKITSIHPEREILSGTLPQQVLKRDSLYHFDYKIRLKEKEPITAPYWMISPEGNNEYRFPPKYLGKPEAPNDLVMPVSIEIQGMPFTLNVPISHKKLDPVRGDVTQRLRIVPAISIEPTSRLFIYKKGEDKKVVIHLKTFKDIDSANLDVLDRTAPLVSIPLPHMEKGTDTFMVVNIPAEKMGKNGSSDYIFFSVWYKGHSLDLGINLIDYPHIPEQQYFTKAWMKVVPETWKVAVHKVGYVDGVGDYVDEILRLCGLTVEQIPQLELNNPDYLKQYDAIVVGIRAFNTQKRLKAGIDGLLQYVQEGGNLIVQYNKSQHLVTDKLGPYPLTLVYDRVTDEKAPVTFTNKKASLLHYPNEISEKDFDDWVQERGLYFPGKWDKTHYQTLFSMHDEGKPALESSVLFTPYGKGWYMYTSLAFFRQLPAGNAGAIRLFMNFLSAGKEAK